MESICKTFKNQAFQIDNEIARAGYTGLGIQEETLSDLLLNRIQFEHEDNFFTRKFTRKEEGNISGSDWLWCIGEPGAWITFAVQAKIVNLKTGRVHYLHYREGEQYNLLVNFSKQFGVIPKYSIFAKVDENAANLNEKCDALKDIPLEQWAFSTVSPKYIKNLSTRKERHISSVLQFAIPWSYVFCSKETNSKSIARQIAQNLEDIYWVLENSYRQQNNQTPRNSFKQIIWENPQPSKLVTQDVPLPVLYLLTQPRFIHKVPIANVSIFSNIPVQLALKNELEKIEGTRQWKTFPKTFENTVNRIQERATTYLLPGGRW